MKKVLRVTENELIKMIGKIISESEEFEFQKLTNDEWEDIWMKLRKTSKSFGIPDNGIFTFGGLFFFYSKNGYLKLPPQKLSDWTDDLNRAAEILDDYVRRLKNIFEESSFDLKLEVGDDYSMRITMAEEKSESIVEQFKSVKPRGRVKIVGNLDGEQIKNVNIMIDKLNELGITDPYAQIGVLAVIGGQSQFKPKNEGCHEGSSNTYLRSLFGDRLKNLSNSKLTNLKRNCEEFFDYVYGKDAKFNWKTGNTEKGDGFKYRGRGFNQITFKHNYKKFGDAIGMDLVSDPDKLNDVNVAAEAAVKFYTINAKGKIPRFKNKEEAIDFFASINAGGGKSSSLDKSLKSGKRFEVEYTPFHLDKPKEKNKTKKEKFDWSSSFRWNS